MSNETENLAQLRTTVVETGSLEDQPKTAEELAVEAHKAHIAELEEEFGAMRPLIRDEILALFSEKGIRSVIVRNMLVDVVQALDKVNKEDLNLSRPVLSRAYHEGALHAKVGRDDNGNSFAVISNCHMGEDKTIVVDDALEIDNRVEILEQLILSVPNVGVEDVLYITTVGRVRDLQDRAGQAVDQLLTK